MDPQLIILIIRMQVGARQMFSAQDEFKQNSFMRPITHGMNDVTLEGIYQKYTWLKEHYAHLEHLGIIILR